MQARSPSILLSSFPFIPFPFFLTSFLFTFFAFHLSSSSSSGLFLLFCLSAFPYHEIQMEKENRKYKGSKLSHFPLSWHALSPTNSFEVYQHLQHCEHCEMCRDSHGLITKSLVGSHLLLERWRRWIEQVALPHSQMEDGIF